MEKFSQLFIYLCLLWVTFFFLGNSIKRSEAPTYTLRTESDSSISVGFNIEENKLITCSLSLQSIEHLLRLWMGLKRTKLTAWSWSPKFKFLSLSRASFARRRRQQITSKAKSGKPKMQLTIGTTTWSGATENIKKSKIRILKIFANHNVIFLAQLA